ncbi:MAG: sigma-54 dependent transcriptional regulator [Bdellovibrionota bacterium]
MEEFFLENHRIEAVLVDSDIEGESGSKLIKAIVHKLPRTKVFVLMNDHAVHHAPTYLENGASNIYPLSLGPSRIADTVSYILNESTHASFTNLSNDYSPFIGNSKKHIAVLEQISRMKDASANVLITGESGTGKELVARALHDASLIRSKQKFEAINCGAIPEALLESELFGYKKGAFTDAKVEKKGLFEVCSDGVLFLDEIGEMPLSLQVKLLRVLQEKEVRQLGSTQSVKVNTRVVAATNLDLLKEVERKNFRNDLYYRLAVLKIHMPPLRERSEDIPLLANHFIEKFANENNKVVRALSASQMARLKLADWPGNVRELQNAIERAVVLSINGEINLDDIFENEFCNSVFPNGFDFENSSLKLPLRHADAKKVFESAYLKNLLKHSKGNVTEAAKMADKTRVELYRYLSRNHITPAEFRI